MKHLNCCAVTIRLLSVCTVFLLIFSGVAAAQERLCVTASKANLRSAPDANSDQLWQVEKYHPFIVIEKKGEWYKVKDFEGDTAWIHNSLLGNDSCVITKKEKCNVRSEASMNGRELFTAEKGVPFKTLETKGNWIKVKHQDGDIGWISKKLVW
ncbi:MAG: SH3 domain-containing protein [Pseudomonadota bacterium]